MAEFAQSDFRFYWTQSCVKTRLGGGCLRIIFLNCLLPKEAASTIDSHNRQNRDGSSTRKLCIGVFTQPGPISDMGAISGFG